MPLQAAGRPAFVPDHDTHNPPAYFVSENRVPAPAPGAPRAGAAGLACVTRQLDGLLGGSGETGHHRSEWLLRLVWDRASDGMRLTDRDGTVVMANPAYCRMVGRRPEDVISRCFADAYAPAGRADILAKHRARFATPPGQPWESHVELADGRRVCFEVSHALLDAPGGPPLLLTTTRDVTARVRAEADARAWQARYEAAVRATGQVLYDWDTATGGLTWGGNCAATLGYDPTEMPAHLDGWAALVHPDDWPAVAAEVDRTAAVGNPFRMEYRLRRKDGEYVVVEDRAHSVRAGNGTHMVGFLADVTERRRAEADLVLFRALVDRVTDGVEVIDPATGRFLDVNEAACAAHGYTRAEYLGMSVADIDPLVSEQEWGNVVARLRRTGAGAFESVHRRRDGSTFPVEVSATLVPLGREYMVAVVRDTTEKTRLEGQLRQAQKLEAVGRLAGGVAHDFNNLVTVINGFGDLALDALPAHHPARTMVEEVRAAGDRAADLTRQLLAYGRKQILQPRVLDLGGLVGDLGGMLRRVIGEDVALALDARPVQVSADPGQLSQVIMNLAVNARDAMPRGGRLDVHTRVVELAGRTAEMGPGRYALLEVADTGCGMTDAVRARVFEPFFTTKEVGKGTGLGLATVYGIVTQSGGHVEVQSAVGRGTTFRVYLPAAGPAPDPSTACGAAAGPAAAGGETILLVEDDDRVRALAMRSLQLAGYGVVDAASGERALQTVSVFGLDVDLLVTDVVMPGMGGRELADRLATARPGLRVLFMSGYTDDAVLRHGVEQDVVQFLPKPFTPAALVAKVREVLDGGY